MIAVVVGSSGVVVNIIVADATADPAPDGCFLIDATGQPCGVGWVYDPATGSFTGPNPPPPEE